MSSSENEDTHDGSIFAVSVIGMCFDTAITLHNTYDKAVGKVDELKREYGITDVEEMCRDCWKGYTANGSEVEIQIHRNLTLN